MSQHIFISHASENDDFVKKLREILELQAEGYKVISVVLPGVQAGILKLLFPTEPVHIFVGDAPTGMDDAVPRIFAALGEQLPNDWRAGEVVEVAPVAELLLKLSDPQIEQQENIRRATANAELVYIPADNSREVSSRRYRFTASLGPLKLEDIRWYI